MRLTRILNAQHSDFMFKKKWLVQGRRIPIDTGAEKALKAKQIEVIDALEFANRRPPLERYVIERNVIPRIVPLDENHPLWHDTKCHMFKDSNVLLEGIRQAQLVTKSIVIEGLPLNVEQNIDRSKIPDRSDEFVEEAVRTSFLFDAEQQKLPKRKIPERPAFNLPREYGITESRRNRLIIGKLLQECEKLAGKFVSSNRKIVNNVQFVVPLEKGGDQIQFDIQAETVLTSKKAIAPLKMTRELTESELPDLFPLKYSVSMPQENIYELRNICPISSATSFCHPHTIYLHFSTMDVKNLHETPVTENQFKSRAMVKAFTVAASKAQSLYGPDVKDLPEPVTVQCVQSNGKTMYFGSFQLNTLDLDGVDGTKNVWHDGPSLDLYSDCMFKIGRPVLSGYNTDVLRHFYGFYKNAE